MLKVGQSPQGGGVDSHAFPSKKRKHPEAAGPRGAKNARYFRGRLVSCSRQRTHTTQVRSSNYGEMDRDNWKVVAGN